jgi:hypothetical protein
MFINKIKEEGVQKFFYEEMQFKGKVEFDYV